MASATNRRALRPSLKEWGWHTYQTDRYPQYIHNIDCTGKALRESSWARPDDPQADINLPAHRSAHITTRICPNGT